MTTLVLLSDLVFQSNEKLDQRIISLNDMKALGLVNFEFAPHWDGSEETLNSLREYTLVNSKTVYACQDGGGIVIDSESVELYGNVHLVDYKESGPFDE